MLKEYAKHVARSYPSKDDPSLEIAGIKIYRVIHVMLDPNQMLDPDANPAGEWTFRPYYLGEFTKDGVLKNPQDPLLYWLIPIFRTPIGWQPSLVQRPIELFEQEPQFGPDYELHDLLEHHGKQPTQGGQKP